MFVFWFGLVHCKQSVSRAGAAGGGGGGGVDGRPNPLGSNSPSGQP